MSDTETKTHCPKGAPYDGRAAMRTGWDTKANPFKGDDWRAMRWLSEWWAENAECFRSHCESGPVYLHGDPLTFRYKNYRGEVSTRTVRPIGIRFDATEWHGSAQWLLDAFDVEKEAVRSFAVADINPAPPGTHDHSDRLAEIADVLRNHAAHMMRYAMPGTSATLDTLATELDAMASPPAKDDGPLLPGIEDEADAHGNTPESVAGGVLKVMMSSPIEEPAPIYRVFPVPLDVLAYPHASFIHERGEASPVACLTGEDHHERALAIVAAVEAAKHG